MPALQLADAQQEQFGHDILTNTGPTTTQRYRWLIPLNGSATLTYTNAWDGQTVTAQLFSENFQVGGLLHTVTVVGTVYAVKADPNLHEPN